MAVESLEAMVQGMSSSDVTEKLMSVRAIKNAVIGNPRKKKLCMHLGVIPRLCTLMMEASSNEEDLLIQAAAAMGSFAHGSVEQVTALLDCGSVRTLVTRLCHHNPKVVHAVTRSLRIICESGVVSPATILFSWNNDGDGQHVMQILMRLLTCGTSSVAESVATVIARCCEGPEQQHALVATGGIHGLVALLLSPHPKVQVAALDALASVTRNNSELSRCVVAAGTQRGTNVQALFGIMMQSKAPRVRLLAASCLANLFRTHTLIGGIESAVSHSVLPVVVKLCGSDMDPVVRSKAPFVLAHIVADEERLQKLASDSDVVAKFAAYFSLPLSTPLTLVPRLKEAALVGIAALCSKREDTRKQVMDAKVLPHIVSCLEHIDMGVRVAACQCARSLSRSVKSLRTSLVDAGAAAPLFRLLSDPSVTVQTSASATLCNIVLDFSPMKKIVLQQGGIPRLVALAQSSDRTLRLNCVWALKNLLFQASSDVKDQVMTHLTWPHLLALLNDEDPDVQVQALTLLRNLAYGTEEDIERVLVGASYIDHANRDGHGRLFSILEEKLQSPHSSIVNQALYTVCNVATGNEIHKTAIMAHTGIVKAVVECMGHAEAPLRIAATWCVINLSWTEDSGADFRIASLRTMGVEAKLNSMVDDDDLDVKDRVKSALEQFSVQRARQQGVTYISSTEDDDIDGVPIEDSEDIDGVPMNEEELAYYGLAEELPPLKRVKT